MVKKLPSEALLRKNLGVVFYFGGSISDFRNTAADIVVKFSELVGRKMTYFGYQNGVPKSMRGKRFPDFACDKIFDHDYGKDMLCLQISNDTKELCHDIAAQLYLCEPIIENAEYRRYNCMYFEFPLNTDLSAIYAFMHDGYRRLEAVCAFCSPVMSRNVLQGPKAYNMAVRALKDAPLFSYEDYFLLYHRALKMSNICHVNLIQLLPIAMADKLDIAQMTGDSDIFVDISENCLTAAASDFQNTDKPRYFADYSEEILLSSFRKLRKYLNSILSFDCGKIMYFKPDQWEAWLGRYD